jgi:hypothetical protein
MNTSHYVLGLSKFRVYQLSLMDTVRYVLRNESVTKLTLYIAVQCLYINKFYYQQIALDHEYRTTPTMFRILFISIFREHQYLLRHTALAHSLVSCKR